MEHAPQPETFRNVHRAYGSRVYLVSGARCLRPAQPSVQVSDWVRLTLAVVEESATIYGKQDLHLQIVGEKKVCSIACCHFQAIFHAHAREVRPLQGTVLFQR